MLANLTNSISNVSVQTLLSSALYAYLNLCPSVATFQRHFLPVILVGLCVCQGFWTMRPLHGRIRTGNQFGT